MAARHVLAVSQVTPRPLAEVLRAGDFVITVCDLAHEDLSTLDHTHWSVPDPVLAGDEAAFESAFQEIARRVHDLAPRLAAA